MFVKSRNSIENCLTFVVTLKKKEEDIYSVTSPSLSRNAWHFVVRSSWTLEWKSIISLLALFLEFERSINCCFSIADLWSKNFFLFCNKISIKFIETFSELIKNLKLQDASTFQYKTYNIMNMFSFKKKSLSNMRHI